MGSEVMGIVFPSHDPDDIDAMLERVAALEAALRGMVAGIEEAGRGWCDFCHCYSFGLTDPEDHAPGCAYIEAKALLAAALVAAPGGDGAGQAATTPD